MVFIKSILVLGEGVEAASWCVLWGEERARISAGETAQPATVTHNIGAKLLK